MQNNVLNYSIHQRAYFQNDDLINFLNIIYQDVSLSCARLTNTLACIIYMKHLQPKVVTLSDVRFQ